MRGDISPTIIHLNLQHPDWHEHYKESDADIFDLEGYDKNGYNNQGIDRAGHSVDSYAVQWQVDADPWLEYDAGELLFVNTLYAWSYLQSQEVYYPVCILHYKKGFLAENGYISGCTQDGILKLEGEGVAHRVRI